MIKPPLPVSIIGWLFIAAGTVGFAYHANEIDIHDPFGNDVALALIVRLLAVAGGIALLRGMNWGRWIIAAWLTYHVVLSLFHSISQTIMHAVLLVIISYFLFRPKTNEYFKRTGNSDPPEK